MWQGGKEVESVYLSIQCPLARKARGQPNSSTLAKNPICQCQYPSLSRGAPPAPPARVHAASGSGNKQCNYPYYVEPARKSHHLLPRIGSEGSLSCGNPKAMKGVCQSVSPWSAASSLQGKVHSPLEAWESGEGPKPPAQHFEVPFSPGCVGEVFCILLP